MQKSATIKPRTSRLKLVDIWKCFVRFGSSCEEVLRKGEGVLEADDAEFRRVMELVMNRKHPHLVRVLHTFEDARFYYVVMQQCRGSAFGRAKFVGLGFSRKNDVY